MERALPAHGALLALQEEVELAKLPMFFQDFATSSARNSGPEGGNCIEVAGCPAADVHVRDSKVVGGPQLAVPSAAWAAFLGYAVEGA